MMVSDIDQEREWLEADGRGGFASGTTSGIRTRRYHALLLAATTPPSGRILLVNGCEIWIDTCDSRFALSSQRYTDVVYPDGAQRIERFEAEPWPRWLFRLENGLQVIQELFVPHGASVVALSWRLARPCPDVSLSVRPLISGRDYHALHHENPAFDFTPNADGARLVWHPYPGVPAITAVANGTYAHQPEWYRNFFYDQERARGLDHIEDLASPGIFRWDLSMPEAILILASGEFDAEARVSDRSVEAYVNHLRTVERARRQTFPSALHRAADSYLVRTDRGGSDRTNGGKTIIAGYPWFTDWGRDTFIAMRGLCLATGRYEEARAILLEWAGAISHGMAPNRFPDQGMEPEFNSVDASLWYVMAVHECVRCMEATTRSLPRHEQEMFHEAIEAILSGYAEGTRFGIRLDDDGLLTAGQPGVQLTWMDAKVGDRVVTPRTGKPVEVQALWLNALAAGALYSSRWQELFDHGRKAFAERFWYAAGGYLYDVIDCEHQRGAVDATFRPNQIFAVGGLPIALMDAERARHVVDSVERRLWTPMGLRTLAPGEPGYTPRYDGDLVQRDGAYHQGTVWPWLAGPFVEAWVRVRGGTPAARQEARARFFEPLLKHVEDAGIGHVSEVADAEPPHTPRGCPFQAWSLGELLRLALNVLECSLGEVGPDGTRRPPRLHKETRA